jgi:hypothetical protein
MAVIKCQNSLGIALNQVASSGHHHANYYTSLEAALGDILDIFVIPAGARVTLVVEPERNNVVKPMRGQVEEIAGRQDDFVCLHLSKLWPLFQIRI